jgi:murein DD-endopeptidase MepM/ murein hydrolase activator NlpD
MASTNKNQTVATGRFKSETILVAREIRNKAAKLWLFAVTIPILSTTVIASDVPLSWPIDCRIGGDCWIVKYVDLEAGPGVRDFACGNLTSNGHRGTDIALRGVDRIDRGVGVLAAASGVVVRLRNTMSDVDARLGDPNSVDGRECGNGLLIDHGDGWVTKYCHMRKGSVIVKKGEAVKKGQEIGKVGVSGKTNFPHLHFSVRHNGKFVDPYSGRERGKGCQGENRPMWEKGLSATLQYRPAVILDAGFTVETPSWKLTTRSRAKDVPLPGSTTIFLWIDAFGLKVGDKLEFEIVSPRSGKNRFTKTVEITSEKMRQFHYASWRKIFGSWRPGRYEGSAKLIRELDQKKTLSIIRETADLN